MTWSIGTKRGKKREQRREKRRAARKTRREGPSKQYLGGSEKAYKEMSRTAGQGVSEAREGYGGATDRLRETGDRASLLEEDAGEAARRARLDALASRSAYQGAIGGLRSSADSAIGLRNRALLENDLNAAATRGIAENEAVARTRLAQNTGLVARQARGLAGSMGEGSALGLQQAIASSGASSAELAARSAADQAAEAAKMRYAAAQGQVANALGVADANAGLTYGAAQDVVGATQAARAQDLEAQAAEVARQTVFLNARMQADQAGTGAALDNQGQQFSNQQFVEGTQLGQNTLDAQNKFQAAQNRGLTGFLKRAGGAFSAGKGALDAADYGPTKKLLGGQ